MSQGQARRVRDVWLNSAVNPQFIEHCLGFEFSDHDVRKEFGLEDSSHFGISPDTYSKFITTPAENSPSAVRNWNAAATISSGEVLIGIADDLLPEKGWDELIWEKINPFLQKPVLCKVTDMRCNEVNYNDQDDILPRHPIITRSLFQKYGYYFSSKYFSVGPDNEWLLESLKGKFLLDFRDIKFHHAIGSILNDEGKVICGCNTVTEPKIITRSQIRMHESNWVQKAEQNLNKWPIGWRIICDLAISKKYASEILRMNQIEEVNNPVIILIKLFLLPQVSKKNRVSLFLLCCKHFLGVGHKNRIK